MNNFVDESSNINCTVMLDLSVRTLLKNFSVNLSLISENSLYQLRYFSAGRFNFQSQILKWDQKKNECLG